MGLVKKAMDKYQWKDDDVMKNVDRVIATDSPLMKRAQTTGLQLANRRGLLSSSMAVGAAQDAVLDKAIQIGGQEASQRFGSNESMRDRTFTATQADWDRKFRSSEAQKDRTLTTQQANLDRDMQRQLASWNLSASAQNNAASMLAGFMGTYEQSLAQINANKDLKGSQRTEQIKGLAARRTKFVNMVRDLYDVDISF